MAKDLSDLVQLCGGGRCPRVFLTKDGDFIVQGMKVKTDIRNKFSPLRDEEVVLLPKESVSELLRNIKNEKLIK